MGQVINHMDLKSILHYNHETGVFTWLVQKSKNTKIGSIAGSPRSDGYIKIRINRKPIYAHRLAWFYVTGSWPNGCIDHANRDPSDNRLCNLREASHQENLQNTGKRPNKTSIYKGVSFNARDKNWLAQANISGVHKRIGTFATQELAYIAYCNFVKPLHKEFFCDQSSI
jgi:hypothetical protein